MYFRGRGSSEAFPASSHDNLMSLIPFSFCWITIRDILAQMLISQQERSQVNAFILSVIFPHLVILYDPVSLQRSLRFSQPVCYLLLLLAAQCLDRDRTVGPQLPLFIASNLLLILRLSSFLSVFCSGTLGTANRTSWEWVMMGMGQRHSVSWCQ